MLAVEEGEEGAAAALNRRRAAPRCSCRRRGERRDTANMVLRWLQGGYWLNSRQKRSTTRTHLFRHEIAGFLSFIQHLSQYPSSFKVSAVSLCA